MLARLSLPLLLLAGAAGAAAAAAAQSPVAESLPATPATVAMVTVPAMTPVYLRIDEEISSRKHHNGDRFPIHIDEDVRIGNVVVIPAGSTGEGEVIHAAKAGAGGKAGELLLAARFVRVSGHQVRLRSFQLGAAGRDRTDESMAVGFIAGPLGLFVRGGVMIIPRDTVGGARTAEEIQLPAVEPAAPPSTTKGEIDENKAT